MSKRNYPTDIKELDDLNRLSEIVNDKRNNKRVDKKKSRRDRHYEKQFIRNTLSDIQNINATNILNIPDDIK